MKRFIIVTALLAWAWVGGVAPSASADEPPATPAVAAPALDTVQMDGAAIPGMAATSLQSACTGESEQLLAAPAYQCNFGAPRCSYSGQCDSWCGGAGYGKCLSGCCACAF